jgi:hypothetical protein
MWRLIDFSPFFALGIAERFGLGAAGRFYVAALVAAAAGLASVVWGRRVNPLITGALLWFIFVAAAYLAGIGAVAKRSRTRAASSMPSTPTAPQCGACRCRSSSRRSRRSR